LPASLAAGLAAEATKSSHQMTSALMKPRSKSVWITPAAWGAFMPLVIVQARTSFTPAVK
jgi:hypothetical protein